MHHFQPTNPPPPTATETPEPAAGQIFLMAFQCSGTGGVEMEMIGAMARPRRHDRPVEAHNSSCDLAAATFKWRP